jgi:hypothetical protein
VCVRECMYVYVCMHVCMYAQNTLLATGCDLALRSEFIPLVVVLDKDLILFLRAPSSDRDSGSMAASTPRGHTLLGIASLPVLRRLVLGFFMQSFRYGADCCFASQMWF